MAGTMTFTYREDNNILRVIADWTSDADGNADGATKDIAGRLVKGGTNPAAAGAAPTDNYDVTLTDEDGVNVLAACDDDLADRDTANSEEVYFLVKDHAAGTPLAQSLHPVVAGALTVAVANAGDSNSGRAVLYIDVGRKH